MENMMRMILEMLYCLVALAASGFFVALIYTDLKKASGMKKWPDTGKNEKRNITANRWNPFGNKHW